MAGKKIVYICESIGGGVRRHLLDLINNIDTTKYEVYLIYGADERLDEVFIQEKQSLQKKGIILYQIKDFQRNINVKKDIISILKLTQLLKSIKPDLVHCHSSKAGAIGRIASFLLGIKDVFYTPHGYFFLNENMNNTKKYTFIWIEKVLSFLSKKIIHVSFSEEKKALDYNVVKKEKSIVIYNGINAISFSKKLDDNPKKVIGTIARMDAQKNPQKFIDIAEEMCYVDDNVEFWYIGSGEYFESINKKIKSQGLENRIRLLGFKPNATEFLSNFDVFLSTSLYEGMPYALIESMSVGIPVVASNVTGNSEIVINGYNGFTFELNDRKEAVDKINRLINDESLRKETSEHSVSEYKKKYSLESMIYQYEELYDKN
ncbi:glycosyltransferase family 4 protein [Bacillus sp. mrc49]|uniref:glycosyltransferase family 4 protein n=1 Tax=Bacillus sp. mrc49 TaxID=2054913 RepID=UPI000C279F01|nr:glycosyltransferase family 4 protein [Bacillus sp. mrc49]PJN89261.1 glycosyltransferase family 1 protein [Bacillus sp. mrc49]